MDLLRRTISLLPYLSMFSISGSVNSTDKAWIPHFTDRNPYVEVTFDRPFWIRNIVLSGDPRPQGLLACVSCGPAARALLNPLTLTRDESDTSAGFTDLFVYAENQASNHSKELFVPIVVPALLPTVILREDFQLKFREGLKLRAGGSSEWTDCSNMTNSSTRSSIDPQSVFMPEPCLELCQHAGQIHEQVFRSRSC